MANLALPSEHNGAASFRRQTRLRGVHMSQRRADVGLRAQPAPTLPRGEHAHFITTDDSIIPVNVDQGPNATKIYVHKSVLCASSEFFKAKARRVWSKGEATVDLPHVSQHAFMLYANWAYSGKVVHKGRDLNRVAHAGAGAVKNETTVPDQADWEILAEAAALGQQLMDSAFKHSVMDTMVFFAATAEEGGEKVANQLLCHALPIQTVYDATPECSGFRNIMLDVFRRHEDFLEQICDDILPNDFLKSLALKLLKPDNGGSGLAKNPCWYHQHEDGESCYSTAARNWKAEFGLRI